MQQILFNNANQTGRCFRSQDTQRIGNFVIQCLFGLGQVQRHRPAGIRARPHAAENQMCICHSRPRPAKSVGGRTGISARPFRPCIHQTGAIDTRNCAAAGADGVNINRRCHQVIIVDRQ